MIRKIIGSLIFRTTNNTTIKSDIQTYLFNEATNRFCFLILTSSPLIKDSIASLR